MKRVFESKGRRIAWRGPGWTLPGAGLLLLVVPMMAQTNSPSAGLQPNPTLAMRAFEPPASDEYTLGRGDEITIDFGARIELNSKRTVGPDGRITLPMAGSIQVADKTRDEAAAAILAAMSTYYPNLTITVGVEKYVSNRILLLGAVEHPGSIVFDAPPTLLEVISRGGLPSNASFSQTKASVIPERCAIYRGADKVMWIDLKSLLDSGSPLADMRLRRDDIVYVPSTADRYISVLGQVQHPGAIQLETNSTLAKLIAEAGGLTDAAGNNPEIRIISPTQGTTRTITFKSLLSPAALDVSLKPGDVVFVPKSGFNQVTYALEKVSPLISIFTAFAFLEQ